MGAGRKNKWVTGSTAETRWFLKHALEYTSLSRKSLR